LECQTNQDCTTEPEATLPLQLWPSPVLKDKE
jgi:hypothetical protein